MARSSTTFRKGQSGNPKGRPRKGYSITEMFRSMFTDDPSLKARLAETIYEKAVTGDIVACRLVWSYMDGLPKDVEVNQDKSLEGLIIIRPDRSDDTD